MKRKRLECNREELFDVSMMISFSVTLSKKFNHKDIEKAFKETLNAYEMFNTHMVIDENGDAWYEEYKDTKNSLSYTDLSFEELIHTEEKKRFHLEEGEYLRLFVKDTNDTTELYYFAHHISGDGKSHCYFIESFLRCLDGQHPSYSEMCLLEGKDFPKESRIFLLNCFTSTFNFFWRKRHVFTFEELDRAFNNFWKDHETVIEFDEIDKEKMKDILDQCHKHKISFTSYYAATLYEKLKDLKKIGFAVSIRADKNHQMGNHAAGVPLSYVYDSDKDLFTNAEEIHTIMKKSVRRPKTMYFALDIMRTLTPSLVDSINMVHADAYHDFVSDVLFSIIGYKEHRKLSNIGFSNLGVADIQTEYSDFHIDDIIFVPPNISYTEKVIGLITINGKLHVGKRSYKEK